MAAVACRFRPWFIPCVFVQGWEAKCMRVNRYFDLRRRAASGEDLAGADAAALQSLMLDKRSLEWWFRRMQAASALGFLTPTQLCAIGVPDLYAQQVQHDRG